MPIGLSLRTHALVGLHLDGAIRQIEIHSRFMRKCRWMKHTVLFRWRQRSRSFLQPGAWRIVFFALLLGYGWAPKTNAQEPPSNPTASQSQSGTSTGGAHAPVKDAQQRPITAGGFVSGAPVIYVDITHAAGLDKFHHHAGSPEKRTILEKLFPAAAHHVK